MEPFVLTSCQDPSASCMHGLEQVLRGDGEPAKSDLEETKKERAWSGRLTTLAGAGSQRNH